MKLLTFMILFTFMILAHKCSIVDEKSFEYLNSPKFPKICISQTRSFFSDSHTPRTLILEHQACDDPFRWRIGKYCRFPTLRRRPLGAESHTEHPLSLLCFRTPSNIGQTVGPTVSSFLGRFSCSKKTSGGLNNSIDFQLVPCNV